MPAGADLSGATPRPRPQPRLDPQRTRVQGRLRRHRARHGAAARPPRRAAEGCAARSRSPMTQTSSHEIEASLRGCSMRCSGMTPPRVPRYSPMTPSFCRPTVTRERHRRDPVNTSGLVRRRRDKQASGSTGDRYRWRPRLLRPRVLWRVSSARWLVRPPWAVSQRSAPRCRRRLADPDIEHECGYLMNSSRPCSRIARVDD